MTTTRRSAALGPLLLALALAVESPRAAAEVSYDDGLRVTGPAGGMGLNVFVRPRYVYEEEPADGSSRSTFELEMLGARLRAWDRRGVLLAQVMGGMAVDEPLLLDSFVEVRPARNVGLRAGYFRVGFDEQTTHYPFLLRMTRRSIDVEELAHFYDLGIAAVGSAFRNAFAFSLSVTNGEAPSLQNVNADFLYATRLALRLGQLLGWDRADLVLGAGLSWNLEPWEPEPETRVNRSVLSSTFDLTARYGPFSLGGAVLYRYLDPGAYGRVSHALGWHVETGIFGGEYVELAARLAHFLPTLDEAEGQRLEASVALNGFPDRSRLRAQLEYTYLALLGAEVRDGHRVVVQLQARY